MSATVLVTGAGGFVGSAVTRRMVCAVAGEALHFHDGVPVTHVIAAVRPGGALDRLETLPQESRHWSVEYCDLTDVSAVRDLFARRRPRAVMHLAIDQTAYIREDELMRRHVIEAPLQELFSGLAAQPGSRIVFTSSAWVLPAGDRLEERTIPQPVTTYGRNKLHAERQLPIQHERTGVDWINLRLFNMFGRYESSSRLLPYLVDRLSKGHVAVLGNPDAVKDFTDVDVIADAYVAALAGGPGACATTYHIGSGRGITIRAFASTVAEVVGRVDLIRPGGTETRDIDVPCQIADPRLARQVLGWSAGTDVHRDIQAAARWCLTKNHANA
jgi:polyisoprenyl-phosphate glycosyltransferase